MPIHCGSKSQKELRENVLVLESLWTWGAGFPKFGRIWENLFSTKFENLFRLGKAGFLI